MSPKHYFTKKTTNLHTIGFYNLENLFDTKDDLKILDDDFLPDSEKHWNKKRYQKKLFRLGTDERGIDVGLLYQKAYFTITASESIEILIDNEHGNRDYTRDILWVTGHLNNEEIHILVNHWPSRRDGAASTSYKRVAAAKKNREIIDRITVKNPDAKIIVMGDFNDDPYSESVKKHITQQDFYNPMERLHTRSRGTLNYKGQWNLFDQIIFSNNFHQYKESTHSFAEANIFDDDFLKVYKGRYKGTPFRAYAGKRYKGGYSDHFPVYVQLKLN